MFYFRKIFLIGLELMLRDNMICLSTSKSKLGEIRKQMLRTTFWQKFQFCFQKMCYLWDKSTAKQTKLDRQPFTAGTYLIAPSVKSTDGPKLLTLRQVLQYVLCVKEISSQTTPTSIVLTQAVENVSSFWNTAEIGNRKEERCEEPRASFEKNGLF